MSDNPHRLAREVEQDALARMMSPGIREVAWDEGFAAGRAAADEPWREAIAFINWFAEGPCGCDGDPQDPCDSCRALALLTRLDDLAGRAAASPDPPTATSRSQAETLARTFHESYEALAPSFGYQTREASAVPWEDVPDANKALMMATAAAVLRKLSPPAASPDERLREAGRETVARALWEFDGYMEPWHDSERALYFEKADAVIAALEREDA